MEELELKKYDEEKIEYEREQKYLSEKRVIFCTLITSGIAKFKRILQSNFSYLFIDEATQQFEPMTLVPMIWNPRKLVLFGDHKQLDSYTRSDECTENKFTISFFERLINAGKG